MDSVTALAEAQRAASLIHSDAAEAAAIAGKILAHEGIDPRSVAGSSALALAHTVVGRIQIDLGHVHAASRELLLARELLQRADADTKAYVLLTAVTVTVNEGRLDEALAFVNEALEIPTVHEGSGRTQRALILQRLGDTHGAIEEYRLAEALLSDADVAIRVRVLLNRGAALGYLGRFDEAIADLQTARSLSQTSELGLLDAKATHNLGFIAGLQGDLIGALELYAEASGGYERAGAGTAVLSSDRGAALAAAGLFREARADISTSIQDLLHRGLLADCTDARIQDVRLALAIGDPSSAELTARVAEREFRAQGRDRWAAVARGYRIVASERSGTGPVDQLRSEESDLVKLTGDLEDLGWASLAWNLRSVLARRLEAVGRHDDAMTVLTTDESPPTDFSVQLAYAEAQIQRHRIAGRIHEVRIEFSASMALLDEHRTSTGSAELRARATALANDLLDAILSAEGSIGDAAGAMRALDAYRDATLRLWPLHPSGDHVASSVEADPAKHFDPMTVDNGFHREAELIRSDRSRRAPLYLGGVRTVEDDNSDRFPHRSAMYLVRNGTLEVIVREGSAISHQSLCPLDDVTVGIERLRALLAPAFEIGTRGTRAKRRLAFECEELSELLVAALPSPRSNEPLVIVPDPSIAGCPWGMLDAIREASFVVSPSLASWRRASRLGPPRRETVALISGPRLLGAEREVRSLSERFDPSTTVLVGPDATSKATLDAFASADLVHLAAHGHFRDDHPLLSGLELVDRTVFGYDVDRLERTPQVVVLSACGVAQHDGQPGSHLGLAAVFLAHGTGTVVAPLVDVPDELTADLMMRFHELLPEVGAAAALAHLRTMGDEAAQLVASAFIAIGAG
jgi:tetratricopeptide (TPR) repeat protein